MDFQPQPTIQLGSLTIFTWGFLFSIAMAAGLIWSYLRAEEEDRDHIINLGIVILLSAVAGSRLAYVIFHPEEFTQIKEIFLIWQGGMVSYGGMVVAVFLSIAYLKKYQLDIYKFIDYFAPPIALSIFITRVGCFLNHCHLGKMTDLSWGLNYANELRHPIALYYAFSGIAILLILLGLENLVKIKKGALSLTLLTLYPIFRLFADQFALYRPARVGVYNNIFLVLMILFAGYLWYVRVKRKNKKS